LNRETTAAATGLQPPQAASSCRWLEKNYFAHGLLSHVPLLHRFAENQGLAYSRAYLAGLCGTAFRGRVILDWDFGTADTDFAGDNHFVKGFQRLGWELRTLTATLPRERRAFARTPSEASARITEHLIRAVDAGLPSYLRLQEWAVVEGYDPDLEEPLRDRHRLPFAVPGELGQARVLLLVCGHPCHPERHELSVLRDALAEGGAEGDLIMLAQFLDEHIGRVRADQMWAFVLSGIAEARAYIGPFLTEVIDHNQDLRTHLRAARACYADTSASLTQVATLFPYPLGGQIHSAGARRQAAILLRRAAGSEEQALQHLAQALGR
jgi:hypothetical protein